jgi:hypothetical protein
MGSVPHKKPTRPREPPSQIAHLQIESKVKTTCASISGKAAASWTPSAHYHHALKDGMIIEDQNTQFDFEGFCK